MKHLCASIAGGGAKSIGLAPLAAFVIVQCTDAWLTAIGIYRYGVAVEANPIVAWYTHVLGVGVALLAVKAVAIGCAAALHAQTCRRTLSALSALYVVVAIIPWIVALWT